MDESNPNSSKKFWIELLKLVALAIVIIIPFRLFVAQPFIVDGASMDPTFKNGQYLIVDEVTYRFETPKRGSVLIFKFPLNTKQYFIKRVIGLPGETVAIKNGGVSINGVPLNEPYVKFPKNDNLTFIVPSGNYFVMGDNRLGSADSRLWGPVPADDIIGRPVLRVWPPSLLPGDETRQDSITVSTTTQQK